MPDQKTTFHVGLTMAGAVSAGAYTGGVMDYLFELLDKWEKAKAQKLPGVDMDLVPQHRVVISAMGGTSAGGMTTVMSAIHAIRNEMKPITDSDKELVGGMRDNVFYDSWVNLDDDQDGKTLEKALRVDDLAGGIIKALLNSDFIDAIAERAFAVNGSVDTPPNQYLPDYIDDHLEVLVSHTMVRGIPLKVNFANSTKVKNDSPGHISYEHFLFSHFKLNGGKPVDQDRYLWLNPFDPQGKEQLKNAAIATGAFPVGLKFREFESDQFSPEYLKTVLSRIVSEQVGQPAPELREKINWDYPPLRKVIENYHSNTLDGGAINNEPYGEVLNILKAKHPEDFSHESTDQFSNIGVVMIDPFPDIPDDSVDYKAPNDLIRMLLPTIGTLWNQSKVKRSDFVNQFDHSNILHGSIYPAKRDPNGNRLKYPIASASLDAFGGFLDIRFRHHDFYLGRNNSRNFLRTFFSFPYSEEHCHPIHKDWTPAMVDRFKVELDGQVYLPIIPDMNLLLEDKKPTLEEAIKYSIPEMPQLKQADILALEKALTKRIRKVTNLIIDEALQRKEPIPKSRLWKRLKVLMRDRFLGLGNRFVASKVRGLIIRTILEDLAERELLDKKH